MRRRTIRTVAVVQRVRTILVRPIQALTVRLHQVMAIMPVRDRTAVAAAITTKTEPRQAAAGPARATAHRATPRQATAIPAAATIMPVRGRTAAAAAIHRHPHHLITVVAVQQRIQRRHTSHGAMNHSQASRAAMNRRRTIHGVHSLVTRRLHSKVHLRTTAAAAVAVAATAAVRQAVAAAQVAVVHAVRVNSIDFA